MKILTITFLLFFFIAIISHAQNDSFKFIPRKGYTETAFKLLVGANIQGIINEDKSEENRRYFEIGLHKARTYFGPQHPASVFTHGISAEVNLNNTRTIYGFKYGAWVQAYLFVLGINGVYYTDFDKGNFKIRPEIGFGAYPFKLTAGYNIPTFQNKQFESLRRAQFQATLNILIRVKRIK